MQTEPQNNPAEIVEDYTVGTTSPAAPPDDVAEVAHGPIMATSLEFVLPQVTPPVTKQEERHQRSEKFVPVRCKIETHATTAVNNKCSARYMGTFDVRFDNPNDVTAKSLAGFCMTGAVFFTADDLAQQPALKKIRKAEGGVNLSALMTRAKRPANIDDVAWSELVEMWKDVSTVLRIDGITPMHSIVMNTLASAGCGGPKINKKLGGGTSVGAEDEHDVMCNVLLGLAATLDAITRPN